jgi:cytoskeletal protein CcmA (bactofilin family)
MFRRNDESEWARFSKSYPSNTKDEKKDEPNGQLEGAPERPTGATADDAAPLPAVPTPSSRILAESNVSLPRPTPMPAPAVFPEEVESTIGPSSLFDGIYKSDSGVRVHGTAKGEIESAKAVYIEESAKVAAKVTAAHIVVAGEVNGELCCTGRVEIKPTGRVTGTINAGTLVMQEGAFFDGNLKMKTGVSAEPVATHV